MISPLLALVALVGPATTGPVRTQESTTPPNVLVVVLDDMGVDTIGSYGEATSPPPTPNIDALAAGGLRFRRAWADPICSPSRAALLTGRHGFRLGIGNAIPEAPGAYGLPTTTVNLARELSTAAGYATAAFGKWHLAGDADGPDHPRDLGFDHYDGSPTNLDITPTSPWTYENWPRVVDGVESIEQSYLTTQTVDSARAWIQAQTEPWFAYVAFHAVHSPFHWPPAALHSVDAANPPAGPVSFWQHRAMVESVDTELGRLIAGLGLDTGETTLLLVSDNGTATPGVEPPFPKGQAKSTLFQGGVRVPLIVHGAGVAAPGVSDALVHIVDLYATVAEIAGLPSTSTATAVDSLSLAPYLADASSPSLRAYNFAESFRDNGPGEGQPPLDSLGGAMPGAPALCQPDLGFGSAAEPSVLSLCGTDGQGLVAGNAITLLLEQAEPFALGLLAIGTDIAPMPFLDGTLASSQFLVLLPLFTDGTGRLELTIPGQVFTDLGPASLTVQCVSQNPNKPQGNDLSNAIDVQIPPLDRKTIRDLEGYKLIVTAYGGKERLYHLPSDPFEQVDLLAAGEAALDATQLAALQSLRTELQALLASAP